MIERAFESTRSHTVVAPRERTMLSLQANEVPEHVKILGTSNFQNMGRKFG